MTNSLPLADWPDERDSDFLHFAKVTDRLLVPSPPLISMRMTDTRDPKQRSRIMKSVGVADTGPELTVRRILFRDGYRYRLHPKTLPGKPDIAFPGRKKAIFVHGCFWHGHACEKGKLPKSKLDYWQPKIENNRVRDHQKKLELEKLGWAVLEVWQCELNDATSLRNKLLDFLGPVK